MQGSRHLGLQVPRPEAYGSEFVGRGRMQSHITLQNILGYKSLSMTQRYAHLIPEHFEKTQQIMQDFWQGHVLQSGDTKVTRLA
jgi:hypothetical protein